MAAFFAAVVTLLTYRAAIKLDFSGQADADHWVLQGFRQSIYQPVVAFLDGANPYDGPTYTRRYATAFFPLYSPVTLAVHLPFGLLPFAAASLVYYLFTLLLTLLLAALALRWCDRTPSAAAVLGMAALILLSRPGQMNLLLGQSAVELVIGALVALRYGSRRPWLAGLGLALTTLKPTLGLPLAFLMWWRKERRAVLRGLAIAAALSGAASVRLVTAAGGVTPFLESVRATYVATEADPAVNFSSNWSRIDLPALIARATGWAPGVAWQVVILIGVLGISARCLHRLAQQRSASARNLSTTLTCVAVLVCAYHQAYDLLLLTLPLAGLALNAGAVPARPSLRWVLLGLLALPWVNYFAGAAAIEALRFGGLWWRLVTSLNGAALTTALLILVYLGRRPLTAGAVIPEPAVAVNG